MSEVEILVALAAMLLATGALAGFLAGLLGVGGGIVLVPAFHFVFSELGYDGPQLMQVCLGTSLATIVVTSLRSVLSHDRRGSVDREILRGWALPIALGAALGVSVAAGLRTAVLQGVFGVLALWVGVYLSLGKAHWRLAQRMPQGVARFPWGIGVGGLSVLAGIGGGSFGVPLMTLHGIAIQRAVGTAAGFGTLIAVPGVIGFAMLDIANPPPFSLGAINLPAFALIVGMTILSAPVGVWAAHRLDRARLRRLFGIFLICVALNMLRMTLHSLSL